MKKTTNKYQRNYMLAKAHLETLRDIRKEMEHEVKEYRTMLKTNSKQAAENVRAYICDNFNFEPFQGYTDKPEPQTFPEIAAFILDTFNDEKPQKYDRPSETRQHVFIDWCAGLPSVLDTCYFYNRSAVDDLGAILEETDTEKERYTEEAAENLLTSLIYKELTKGARQ